MKNKQKENSQQPCVIWTWVALPDNDRRKRVHQEQLTKCEQYASAAQLQVQKVFSALGKGKKLVQAEFDNMIEFLKGNKVYTLVIPDFNKLPIQDRWINLHALASHGVKVISVNEPYRPLNLELHEKTNN